MSDQKSIIVAFLATLAIVVVVVAATGGFVWAGLGPDERAAAAALVARRAGLAILIGLIITGLVSLVIHPVIREYVSGARRLAEETRIMLSANPDYRIPRGGPPGLRELGEAVNELAEQVREQRQDVEAKIAVAKASVEEERTRLAALMSELTQGVLVCNGEGRILLYNERARELFVADRSEAAAAPVGLGRSVFGLLDRNLIAHGLDAIQQRLEQGEANPVAQFLTATRGGQWLRAHLAQVRAQVAPESGEPQGVPGFVLSLDDVTRAVEDDSRRDRVLRALSEGIRAPLANVRAAVESLLDYGDMDDAQRTRFLNVIAEEANALSTQLDQTMHEHADSLKTRWPLESVLGADVIAAAQRRIEARLGMRTVIDEVDSTLWLEAESFSLVEALAYLAGRLKETGVREVRLRLVRTGRHAELDLAWQGAVPPPATLRSWEEEPMRAGDEGSPLSLKDVVERHAGEAWHHVDGAGRASYFRLLLPAVSEATPRRRSAPAIGSRPEYYDFDLFHQPGQSPDLDSRRLAELAYTVFDTETTGLDPSAGDEIIAIGAVRIVNGRLLRHELFDQLIDPLRSIAPESVRVHGITPEMVAGQPTIDRILPGFHRFSEDTVLVAHNAAFDMRFLQLKEATTGVRFTQPVLDTLLLSEVLHPNIKEHRLEAISERLGISVVGRHTALGDAIVTGEVFLRMVPLLVERGIRTLGEAREASRRTHFARVKY